MALSGDIEAHEQEVTKTVGVRLECQIWFNNEGQVSYVHPDDEDVMFCQNVPHETVHELIGDRSKHHLTKVIQVIDGNIESALPLIGHRMFPLYPNERGLQDTLKDGVLTETDEVRQQITRLGHRNPASLLVVHENNIYGVIIDENDNCRVVGRVRHVIPKRDLEDRSVGKLNAVTIGKERGVWTVDQSTDHNLKTEIKENGVIFCMISEGGYAFIEANDVPEGDEELRELVLITNRGYIFFKELSVDWMRLMIGLRVDEFATRTTRLKTNECLVTHRGGYLRYGDDRIQTNGGPNAILDFDAFRNFLDAMGTVGYKPDQMSYDIVDEEKAEEEDEKAEEEDEKAEEEDEAKDKSDQSLLADQMAGLEITSPSVASSKEEESLREEVDSDYDNISPDSFS